MSLPRTRHTDVLQRIITTFNQFERKLDKLLNDVNHHGQTLVDLHVLLNNLSMNTIVSPDARDVLKHTGNKTTAIQYDNLTHLEEPQKHKRKHVVQSLSSREKKIQGQKSTGETIRTYPSNARTVTVKRSPRLKKAEAPRKATTLRPQKSLDKKRNKGIDAEH